MGKIDRNEAPEGMVAKSVDGSGLYPCIDCALLDFPECLAGMCMPKNRKDGQSVIFVKRPEKMHADLEYSNRQAFLDGCKAGWELSGEGYNHDHGCNDESELQNKFVAAFESR